MVYDSERHVHCDGEWHCPFSRDWLLNMKRAVKDCIAPHQVRKETDTKEFVPRYVVPPCDFLREPQDARGLPLSWCREYEARHEGWAECCVATYDYDSIPETVVTNGDDDWPMVVHERVLIA